MVGVFKCVFLCVCIKSWLSRKVLIDLLIYLQKKNYGMLTLGQELC